MNAIEVNNICKSYGEIQALKDFSFAVAKGSLHGLIGPDGTGKTSMFRILATLVLPDSGTASVDGFDVVNGLKDIRQRVGYMPGRFSLYQDLTVEENLRFFATLFGTTIEAGYHNVKDIYGQIEPFKRRRAGALSGGMKQKLALSCALIHQPSVLLLDEPTTGVDPVSRTEFWDMLARLKQQGITILVSTPYQEEIKRCDEITTPPLPQSLHTPPTHTLYINKVCEATKNPTTDNATRNLSQAETIIHVSHLVKTFGTFNAVDDISFDVRRGEIFGFLGSNGCGKSTTMKMLTGLLEPTSGTAKLLGEPIDAGSIETKKRVGYMSQAFSLYEELTVRQNLELHAKLYQIADGKTAISQALRDFDLSAVEHTKPASLPLGIRQRLQLAAACLHSPEVLILDEPTSGVDPAARAMFWRTLLKLSRQDRITIFVTTHFMNEVERCDRISLMHRGRVLAMGTPAELVKQSGQPNMEEAFIHYLEQDAAETGKMV